MSRSELERELIRMGGTGRLDRFFSGRGDPSLSRSIQLAKAIGVALEELVEEVAA